MSNKKQTAVEWLVEQLLTQGAMKVISNSTYYFDEEIIKKALQMEKEQMIDFGFDTYCFISGIMKVPFEQLSENRLNAEHNYNETYA